MALWQWSTTPANNATSAPPINWAEGMPPGLVDDSARQMMADVAQWYQSPEWLNYGFTPTYVSGAQFTVTGNQTSTYSVGRRVRAFVTAGTIYGTVSASAYASGTTVTVAWDSGALDSGLTEVDVGILNPANQSVNSLPILSSNALTVLSSLTLALLPSPNSAPIRFGDGTGWVLRFQTAGGGSTFATLTDQGNFTASGNITANSDERLKKDWADLPTDFIDRLAAVKCGTYTRTDTGIRQIGVGAQSLQPVAPEAIGESESGILSVAYGQAALAACVELAKEVVRLRALLEPAK